MNEEKVLSPLIMRRKPLQNFIWVSRREYTMQKPKQFIDSTQMSLYLKLNYT